MFELIQRKKIIEEKLFSYGIKDRKITFLPYLEFSEDTFQTPYDVGCRILILWALSYAASNLNEKEEIEHWLKTSDLWAKLSDREKKLFTEEVSKRALINFSWNIEAALVLCWAMNLMAELPDLDTQLLDDDLNVLMTKLPIDQDPHDFLNALKFRDKEEIFIENIINELITSYLRDRMFTDKKDALQINSKISFERHYALNWLRKFSEIEDWDETDTAT